MKLTGKQFGIIILALIIAFPFLPGSSSPAFQGVSVFIGVLFSLGSTSVVSNIVAGVEGAGMTMHAKHVSIVGLWLAIGLSAALVLWQAGPTTAALVTVGVLLLVAILVTRYILRRPTSPG